MHVFDSASEMSIGQRRGGNAIHGLLSGQTHCYQVYLSRRRGCIAKVILVTIMHIIRAVWEFRISNTMCGQHRSMFKMKGMMDRHVGADGKVTLKRGRVFGVFRAVGARTQLSREHALWVVVVYSCVRVSKDPRLKYLLLHMSGSFRQHG
jgi:hypothetical protein